MKRILLLTVVCLILATTSSAQEQQFNGKAQLSKKVYVGLGFGFGFFNPTDVNEYIKDKTSHIDILIGVEEIIINYSASGSLNYRLSKIIDLSLNLEYSYGPKFITGDAEEYFAFTKLSPGIAAKLYIPMKKERNKFYVSPGATYDVMNFEEYSASGIGAKLEMGFSFTFGKMDMQPFIAYKYSKAVDEDTGYGEFELDYSMGQIGMNFLF